jgi:hypothetical protein
VYFVAKLFPVFTYLIVSTHFHLFCVLSDFLVFLVNQWVLLTVNTGRVGAFGTPLNIGVGTKGVPSTCSKMVVRVAPPL